MPLEDEFCDILKKARHGQALSLQDLARRSGVPAAQLMELESGRRLPRPDEVEAVARALQLRIRPLAAIAVQGWRPRPIEHIDSVETIHGDLGGYAVKGYVLFDAESRHAMIVDTGYNPEGMVEVFDRRKLTLKAVCLTHGHVDHAGGLDRLLSRWPVPVYIGEEDLELLHWRPAQQLTAIAAKEDGQEIRVGSLKVQCLVTPGHTPGGLCYRVISGRRPLCFVGDTLFAGSIGRANPFRLYPQHLHSVRCRILTLPDDTVLLPGHGPATTVAEERQHNPFAAEEPVMS